MARPTRRSGFFLTEILNGLLVMAIFAGFAILLSNWTDGGLLMDPQDASFAANAGRRELSERPIYDMTASESTGTALLLTRGHDLSLYDLTTGFRLDSFQPSSDRVTAATMSLDGEWIAYCVSDGPPEIVSTHQPRVRRVCDDKHLAEVRSAVFSPDGHLLATGADQQDDGVRLWDARTGRLIRRFEHGAASVHSLRFSPDNRQLLAAFGDQCVCLWDLAQDEPIHTFKGHERHICSAAFLGDQQQIVSASMDGQILIWDSVSGQLVHEHNIRKHEEVLGMTATQNGKIVAFSTISGEITLLSLATYEVIGVLRNHYLGPANLQFSANGHRLYSASHDGSFRVWDVASCSELQRIQ